MREAANALIRVHKASTQNQKPRTKTSKISMSQRDNRKSCHSDQLSSHEKSSRGTIWGTKRADCAGDMLGRECREAPPQKCDAQLLDYTRRYSHEAARVHHTAWSSCDSLAVGRICTAARSGGAD